MSTERKLYGYVIHGTGADGDDVTGDGLFVSYTRDPVPVARRLGVSYKIVEVYA